MYAAVVSVIVEDILQSLGEGMKLGKRWGIEHGLREIPDLLSSIREVLTEAENKYGRSLELQEWVQKIKKAVFFAEKLLEELSVKEALWQRKRKVSRLFRPLVKLTFRWRMPYHLRNLPEYLRYHITSDRISFVRNIPFEIGEADQEARTVPFIGRDYEKGELMRRLLDRGRERKGDLPVLRVHGSGGVGNMALVQEFCSESELNRYFNDIIWVDASPHFNVHRMARDIIASLMKDGAAEEENDLGFPPLMRMGKLLDGRKKYLFVLDNLLVPDSRRRNWADFRSRLKGKRGVNGNEIIVITRDPERISYKDMSREGKRDLSVLRVNGNGGIGKTALVQEVLSESELNQHFDIKIWVNAYFSFDENRIARDIIASLTKGGATEEENVGKEQLLLRIRKLLDGRKKYLFILDDLSVQDSERQRWLRFLSFLEGGATGSKILVTTRDPIMIYYEESLLYLGGLTQEDSHNLLLKTAFVGGVKEIIDPAKLQIAKEVVAKCYGNPLFIRAVCHYLSLQHSASDWSCFRDWVNNSVLYRLLYGGGYPYGHLGLMVKRYNHLPPRIKQCFGLCSLFPRGHSLDRQTLAELWLALGYIKSSNEDHQPLEDIADAYFNRLLEENFFQVKILDTFGKVRSVVLHTDAEHLCRSIAGRDCAACLRNDFFWKEVADALHISVTHCWKFSLYFWYPGLQTVLHFIDDTSKCEAMWNHNITYLMSARVLDFHRMNVEKLHEGVRKLTHLRYLDISDNRRIETLPPAITGLLNLQTLKLSGCSALKELPQDMCKMVTLRHLYIDGCRKLSFMPKGLGDLKFLSILTDFILPPDDSSSVDFANLADLCKLNDLRGSLKITNLGYSEYEREATRERFKIQWLLDQKCSLESLELTFRNQPTDKLLLDKLQPHFNLKGLKIQNYGGVELPEWMNRPSNHLPKLVEVSLIECRYLNDNYFPQFGQLRHLKSLTIHGLPDLLGMESGPEQSSPDVANNAQPSSELSSLCISDCPKLECLPKIPRLAKLTLVNVSEQLFRHPFYASSLKTLRLENIGLLHHLPEEWLRDLTSLEELHIESCPKLIGLSTMIPSLAKLTMANVSKELFWKPCRLPSLKTLRLENIELLHHLPGQWLRYLTSLEELHIRSCPSLVSLSRSMMRLKNLVSLSIWNCKELDLSKDEHGKVMMELQVPKSLKFLTIYKALKMEYLPEWLSRVYTLRFLCIRSCPKLVALPEWIIILSSLKLIELVHCPRLTSLPAGMYDFTDEYPRKLSVVGCPLLQAKENKHSPRL